MNLAIISPNQNAYSETFIQAHRNIPGVKVSFYYQGFLPAMLEGKGPLLSFALSRRIIRKIRRKLFPCDYTPAEEELSKSFRKENIECVLAEYGPTGAAVMKVCKKLHIPLIVHFHGFDASQYKVIEEYRIAYKDMFRYASAIIAVSRVMEKMLINLDCPEAKLVYNPCGPNELFFSVKPEFNNRLFIGIGRFVDKKAPYYTVLAFHELLKSHPGSRLIMAGDGPLLATCRNLARFLGIDKLVEFPGIVTPIQFSEYLGQACAFVQHSITAEDGDMEGTPVGVLEASAAGLPVISTFHAGIPDVILNGETGLLVEEHDVKGIAQHMIFILDNLNIAKEMGVNGKDRIKSNFSLGNHLAILKDVIMKAANKSC